MSRFPRRLSRPALLVLLALLALLVQSAPVQAQPSARQNQDRPTGDATITNQASTSDPSTERGANSGQPKTARDPRGDTPDKVSPAPFIGPTAPTVLSKAGKSRTSDKKVSTAVPAGPPGPVLRPVPNSGGLPVLGPPNTKRSALLPVRSRLTSRAFLASPPLAPARRIRADSRTPSAAVRPPRPISRTQEIVRDEVVPAVQTLVRESTKNPAFPLSVALVVALFLLVQHRIDAHDPKLADAPLEGPADVGFAPPVRLA